MARPEINFWLGQHLLITTLLAVIVLAACRLFRLSPAARHALWLLVLCRLIVPSVATWPWPLPVGAPDVPGTTVAVDSESGLAVAETVGVSDEIQSTILLEGASVDDAAAWTVAHAERSGSSNGAIPATVASARNRATSETTLFWIVVGVWSFGSAVVATLLTRRMRRVGLTLRGEPPAEEWLRSDVARWCAQLAIRAPRCVVSTRFRVPFVWCLGPARLVWPAALSHADQRRQSRPILVHELAHLKRRDHWTAWIELAALVVWWWNPVFWFVRRQLRTASEMACDAWVVALLPGERRAYAESLVRFSSPWPKSQVTIGAVGANSGSRRAFTRRLEMIMNEQVSARFSRWSLLLAVLLGLVSLPAFSTETEPADAKAAAAFTTATDNAGRQSPSESADAPPTESSPALDRTTADSSPSDDPDAAVSLNEVLEQIANNYYGTVDRGELERAAVEAILSNLDGNSQLLSREELNEMTVAVEGELMGVGVALDVDDESQLPVVTRTLRRTPAHAAGMQAGDVLLNIDGAPTAGRELNELVQQLRGPRGSTVTVRIRRGEETRDIDIVRDSLAVSRVEPWSVSAADEEEFWISPAARIGYVHIPAFTRQTASQLRQVLAELTARDAKGLVLDLRNCPGGLLTAATEAADLFIEDGVIVTSRGRNEGESTIRATRDGTFENLRVAVLVNGHTASAAEIVAACLQDHHRAAVVGERTFGRGTVQSIFPLEDGGALKLTTAAWLRPNGRPLQRTAGDEWGVQPDGGLAVPLSDDERQRVNEQFRARLDGIAVDPGDDPQLKTALDWLAIR